MSDDKKWERRILQSMGSNFRIDVNNPQTTVGGNDIYNIYSSTDDGDVCLVGYQKDGTYRIFNDKRIEIAAGQTSNEGGVDIVISGKNGDVVVTAEKNGRVRIRGKNIIMQADEDVDISAGRNVNLKSGSGRILLSGNTLEKDGLKGNLLDPEAQCAQRVFEGTGLPGFAFAALASPFSGVASLAGSVLSNPASLGGLVSGAVGGAISGSLGGLAGSVAGGALSGLGGGLGGIAQGALGSVTGNLGSIAGDLVGGAGGDLLGSTVSNIAGGLASGGTDVLQGALKSTVSGGLDLVTDEIGKKAREQSGPLGGNVANTALSRVRGNLPF